MAVINFACGFETGQAALENVGTGGAAAFSTTTVRTGARSLRCNPAAAGTGYFYRATAASFVHVAIYIASMPSGEVAIWGDTGSLTVRLGSDGRLRVYDNITVVGTSTTALTTGRWYWLGLRATAAISSVYLQIDGADEVTGTSTRNLMNELGSPNAAAAAYDVYFDDWIGANQFLAPSKVALLIPISDYSTSGWRNGNNTGTTNLYTGVDNIPPAGVASASETATTNIESALNTGAATYIANLTIPTNAGMGASDTLLGFDAFIQHGEDISTGTKTGTIELTANPGNGNGTTAFTFGGDVGAHGATPTNWYFGEAPIVSADDLGLTFDRTQPVMLRLIKTDTTTRVACVDFMGCYLAWTPASGTSKTGGPDTAGTTTDASSLTATMTPTDTAGAATDASATLDRTGSGDTAGSATDASSLAAALTSAGDTANAATETSSVALPITSAGDTAGAAVDASATLDRTGSGDTAGAATDATANLARTGSGDTAGAATDASALTAALTSSGDTAGAATDASALSVGVTSAGDTAGAATDASSLAAALTSAGDAAGSATDVSSLAAALTSSGDTAGAGVDASVSIGLSSSGDTAGATVDASTVNQGTGTVSAADTAGATVDASSLAAALTSAGDTAGSATDATSSIGLTSAGDTAGATTDASSLAAAATSAGETAGATTDASALTAALTSAGDTAGAATDASALTAALTSAGDTAGAATDASALAVPVTSAGDTAGATVDASSLTTGTVNVSAGDMAGVTVDTSGLTAAITGGDTSGGAANADIRTFDIGWTSDLVGVSFRSIETGDTVAGYDISILNRGLVTPDVYYRPTVETRTIVAVTMYADMVARYGLAEGRRIYFAMEAERKGPFAPGAKYDTAARPAPAAAPRPVIEIPEARRN